MRKFDLEVAGTHNYFVDGVMVHNSPETTPGGRALKFYSSVRLDIRRIESLKDGAEVVGNRTRVKVVKNKVSPPFRQAEFDIMYGKGISREGTLIDMAVDLGIVRKSGAWFTYEGEQLGQGRENAKTFLAENPEIMMEISDKVLTAAGLNPVRRRRVRRRHRPRRRRCRRSDRLDRRSRRSACRARMTAPQAWSVVARNLPEHAGNADPHRRRRTGGRVSPGARRRRHHLRLPHPSDRRRVGARLGGRRRGRGAVPLAGVRP